MSDVSRRCIPPPTPYGVGDSNRAAVNGPKARAGAACLMNVGKGTENQDTFVFESSKNGSKSFVGVFDGHGDRGGRISEFAKGALTRSLFGQRELHSNPKAALQNAYRETQKKIEAKHGSEAEWSGTTAISAYQHRDKLFVANVGDSRAVLARCDTARSGHAAPVGLSAVDLSSDQKPDRPDERKRIIEHGGIVQQGTFPVDNGIFGPCLVRAGPQRVMHRNGMGGLAMSRSLGDLSLRPYVSSHPEVYERKLSSKDKMLILGTDGVWDQVSSQEAVNIASQHRDPSDAAREIASVARKRWHVGTQGQMSDDITAVVVNLDHTDKNRAQTAHQGSSSSTARSGCNEGLLSRLTTPALSLASSGGSRRHGPLARGHRGERHRAGPESVAMLPPLPEGAVAGAASQTSNNAWRRHPRHTAGVPTLRPGRTTR